MNITPEQLKATLEEVVADRIEPQFAVLNQRIDTLQTSVDKVSKTWDDHLKNEWPVHVNDAHSRIDRRLKRHDHVLKIDTDSL